MTKARGEPSGPDVLERLAAKAVSRACASGATAAEALAVETTPRRWSTTAHPSGPTPEQRLGVRVVLPDGRAGWAESAVSRGGDPLARLVDAALDRAQSSEPDPFEGIPRNTPPIRGGLAILDPRLQTLADTDRLELLHLNTEGCATVDPRVTCTRARYEERVVHRTYASSRGVALREVSTCFSMEMEVRLGERTVSELFESRHFADVASRPLGVDLARRLLARERTAPLPDSPTYVAFAQPVVAGIVSALSPAFDSAAIDAGHSFLSGRLGQPVGSSKVHLVDDATLPRGLGTRAFDDRGVTPVPITVLREGVAYAPYLDPRQAFRRQARPTGHARFDGSVWPGNLVLRPGTRTRNMIFPDLGRFVLVTEVAPGKRRIDPKTGRIRLPVLTHVYEGAEAIGCAGEHVLVTTAADLLASIQAICSDQERHGIVDTATWICEGPWFE